MKYLRNIMHIGIDDTDSTRRGCTTHVAALLVERFTKLGVKFVDYPGLIRLNPNVPWKTRGNGALCLRIDYEAPLEDKIRETTINLVEANSDIEWKGTDPGIVFFPAKIVPEEIKTFAKRAITEIVTLKDAIKLIQRFGGEALGYNTQRGIIGALAGIGENLENDHTYELIAYRNPKNYTKPRKVDEASIFEMDKLTQPYTFNNVDYEKKRVIITPRGPDPVLLGIRGETPQILEKAYAIVKPLEPVDRWLIFRSNQGTDAHLKRCPNLNEIEQYSSVTVTGVVSRNPRIVPLRHVIFSIKDDTGEVDCAAYEPTGNLRKIARDLILGDKVEVSGAARKTKSQMLTINIEKLNVLQLTEKTKTENALCQKCQKRLKSMGKNQGYRCEKCGTKYPKEEKLHIRIERQIQPGLYFAATRSQRHLTKPLRRYGLEKSSKDKSALIETWHS
jgi:tRNA(Ile2)-agmatinylcytidine synthase